MAATRPGVFAAGDSVSGTAFVIEAVASGHQAAESIHRYLQGEALEPEPKPELPVVKFTRAELEQRVLRGEIQPGRPGADAGTARGGAAGRLRRSRARLQRRLGPGRGRPLPGLRAVLRVPVLRVRLRAPTPSTTTWSSAPSRSRSARSILAPGYQIYQAELSQEYGLGRYPNVVTALQFERLLSASGPTGGHVQRPSDGAAGPARSPSCSASARATRATTTARRCAACTPPKKR